MKMKEYGPPGGRDVPGTPLDPPMVSIVTRRDRGAQYLVCRKFHLRSHITPTFPVPVSDKCYGSYWKFRFLGRCYCLIFSNTEFHMNLLLLDAMGDPQSPGTRPVCLLSSLDPRIRSVKPLRTTDGPGSVREQNQLKY